MLFKSMKSAVTLSFVFLASSIQPNYNALKCSTTRLYITELSQFIALIVNSTTAKVPALTGIALNSVGPIPFQNPLKPSPL